MVMEFDPPSRAKEVVNEIETMIRSKSLAPGDKIATKDELKVDFGVARATVNEAVKLLHDRGRIFMKPGPRGGVFVARADPGLQLGRFFLAVGEDPSTIADAVALRDYLETMILEEATKHRDDDDIRDLRACLEDLAKARSNPERFLEVGWSLHERIGLITPNEVLKSTYCGLVRFIRGRVTRLTSPARTDIKGYLDERLRLHRDLVDVIESADLARVPAVIAAHYSPL